MQVTETLAEGLKRELKVVIPVEELSSRLDSRLKELSGRVAVKGFRPGKVPVSHLKRLYGRSAMAEIVQEVLSETTRNTLSERGERAAMQPQFNLPEEEAEAEKILNGEADLSYSMVYEILPAVTLADFKALAVERPVVEVKDEEVDAELKRLADSVRPFSPKDGAAETGDRVTLGFVGKIDGVPFEGGTAEETTLDIGSGQFIPGFENQLVGVKPGEARTISVTFPEDYGAAHLAGKAATFDVTVKGVAAPGESVIDDSLAQGVGLESLDKLKEAIRSQIQTRYGIATRQRVKRQVLDQLDTMHDFELPPTMVEQEFNSIWQRITDEMEHTGKSFADEDTTEEAAREEYRKLAERRVRLGLVLSEIGERNKIEITEEEVQRALAAQLRQFPGREQQVYDYYRQNPEAIAGLRAPIFEEKVVDFLMELATVTDKEVSAEELMEMAEDESFVAAGHHHHHDHDHDHHHHHDHDHDHGHHHHDHDHGHDHDHHHHDHDHDHGHGGKR